MELLEKLPILDTAAPRIGFTMIETIDKIYEEYAKSIRIGLFLPALPKKVDGIPTGFTYNLGMYDSYKFVKFKVKGLILICIILKREKTSKTKKPSRDYRVQCVGTNNTVDIYDNPFHFNIFLKSNVIYNGHIHKSNLPGLQEFATLSLVIFNQKLLNELMLRILPVQMEINFIYLGYDFLQNLRIQVISVGIIVLDSNEPLPM